MPRRIGHYEMIDFLAVQIALCHQRRTPASSVLSFDCMQPFAVPFMALFDRDQLPVRSTLSRFLTALPMEPVEALRSLFLDDLLARPPAKERQRGELQDPRRRTVGGLRYRRREDQAARQRALRDLGGPASCKATPETRVCSAGYTGRKRGEVVRTRTIITPRPYLGVSSAVSATEAMGSTGRSWHARSSSFVARLQTNDQPQTRALLR
jgi:hypothetical protein